jgi:two-component system OmpR family sensor kinase
VRPRGLRRVQLRTRVLAGVVSITVIALAVFDVAAVTALRRYLVNQTDAQLQSAVQVSQPVEWTVGLPTRPVTKPAKAVTPVQRAAAQHITVVGPHLYLPVALGQYFVLLAPSHGTSLIFGGNPTLKPRLPAEVAAVHALVASRRNDATWTVTSVNGKVPLRLRAVLAGRLGTLVVATSLGSVDKTVRQVELILAIGSALAALIVGLGVAWLVRRGLRPIETMAAQADRISAGDLTDRVGQPDVRTEVGRLGVALNGMLGRIEASVLERDASQELTRQFFADASHELRNPLASLRVNAELYQQGAIGDRAGVDEAMNRIALEAQRMSRLVDDMLRLARLDQHPDQEDEQVDLSALAASCAERSQLADPGRTWHTQIRPGLVTTGDEEMLRRAIDNLLANVRAHTPGSAAGTITAARQDSTVIIEVSDDGPGVPPDQLPRIFDRFYRAGAPPARPGSGLGLAIVTAIAAAHHGTVEATADQPHGLRLTLTLPARSGRGPSLPERAAKIFQPNGHPGCHIQ